MSREKQIEEMAEAIFQNCNCGLFFSEAEKIARFVIEEQGYRKQKEGHWFILEYEYFTCSECGYCHPNGCDSTEEAKEKLAVGNVPKYCDECGAKMKGGEQE